MLNTNKQIKNKSPYYKIPLKELCVFTSHFIPSTNTKHDTQPTFKKYCSMNEQMNKI